jgi:hypothetical protein
MKPFNEIIVGVITKYSGTEDSDKTGENPIMIQCMAGKMPNRNVLSGTVAIRAGLEVGKTYLINVREAGTDKQFGQDFTWLKMQEITSPLDIIDAKDKLGDPEIIEIPRPEGYEDSYTRKTNAVEGNRTKRIKEGNYVPVTNRSYSHVTAPEVVQGSSTEDNNTNDLFPKKEAEKLNR